MRIKLHPFEWYLRPYSFWDNITESDKRAACVERYKHTKFLCFTITTYK